MRWRCRMPSISAEVHPGHIEDAMSAAKSKPAAEFCNPVVSIASPEERAWERWRLAILRYQADRTVRNWVAVRNAWHTFKALYGETR
jgi:hypothetical protein